MNRDTQRLEALLLTAGEAVGKKELVKLLGVSEKALAALIADLKNELTAHGIAIMETDSHIQLVTSPTVAGFLAQFEQKQPDRLSKAAAETAAIIAYCGPVSRYEVDVIRGVDSRAMIRQLHRRGLVKRISKAGDTPMYDVTEDFLSGVGIKRREELPDFNTLSSNERLQKFLESA